MFSADQIVAHLVGDYLTQSDYMANEKTKRWLPAAVHALIYSLGFLFFRPSVAALAFIFGSHYLIDRYRLARYVVWAKNWMGPRVWWWRYRKPAKGTLVPEGEAQYYVTDRDDPPQSVIDELREVSIKYGFVDTREYIDVRHQPTPPFSWCYATGYPPMRPSWLAVWLLIIADNCCHILLNGAALRWL